MLLPISKQNLYAKSCNKVQINSKIAVSCNVGI